MDKADLYWSLQLNHHAVALATKEPYNTLQVVATPVNFQDTPLDGLPAAQYMSTDPEHVIVDQNGTLIAVAATSQPVAVVATLTANNLKHADTVLVGVVETTTPPILDRLSIHPIPPDSAKVGLSVPGYSAVPTDTLPARATTSAGDPVPVYGRDDGGYLPVYFRSLDTMVAVVGRDGVLQGSQMGLVKISASTNAFGISKVDTLSYRIGAPLLIYDFIGKASKDAEIMNRTPNVTIGRGGAIVWLTTIFWYDGAKDDTIDVTFDDADLPNVAAAQPVADHPLLGPVSFCSYGPAVCLNSGNFLLMASLPVSVRYFPTPGTYVWRSLRKGLTGRIVVVDER